MLDKESCIKTLIQCAEILEKIDDKFGCIALRSFMKVIEDGKLDIKKQKETCKWRNWKSLEFNFNGVIPSCTNETTGINKVFTIKYCPYCGKEIEEIKE